MRELVLDKGQVAKVDDADFEELSNYSWYYRPDKNTGYASRTVWFVVASGEKKCKTVSMHRFLVGLENGDPRKCDHKDGDGLNNQRENLRICTNLQNSQNRHARTGKKSVFKGVYQQQYKDRITWCAYITINGKMTCLGTYATQEIAASVYNTAAKEHFKEFAQLNRVIEITNPVPVSRKHEYCRKGHYKGDGICLECSREYYRKRRLLEICISGQRNAV